jgi:acrylyl-CoA reductase (NADPH)
MFKALVLREVNEGKVESRAETLSETVLPEDDVTVAVEHSTLNYKDGMILQGLGRLVRRYLHIPASISRERWNARTRRDSGWVTK